MKVSHFTAHKLKKLIPDEDRLQDPCNDRQIKAVRPPPQKPLTLEKAFINGEI
jgi:hypothetical protein